MMTCPNRTNKSYFFSSDSAEQRKNASAVVDMMMHNLRFMFGVESNMKKITERVIYALCEQTYKQRENPKRKIPHKKNISRIHVH